MIVQHAVLAVLPALASSVGFVFESHQPSYATETVAPRPANGDTVGPASLCFTARPRPWCRWFLVTEANFYYRLHPTFKPFEPTGPPVGTEWYLSADVGWMWNVSTRSAVGASIFAGHEFGWEGYPYGLRGRYRWWLSSRSSLGASGGIVFGSSQGMGEDPGFTGRLTVGLGDLLLLSAQLDYVPALLLVEQYYEEYKDYKDYGERFYLGASLGSWLGIVSYAAAGLLGLVALGMS